MAEIPTEVPFTGGAYEDSSLNADAQRCINLYVEIDKQGGTEQWLSSTPGLKEYNDYS